MSSTVGADPYPKVTSERLGMKKHLFVDGIPVQLDGAVTAVAVLALAGLSGEDNLVIRTDGGRAVLVSSEMTIDRAVEEIPCFRTFHRGRLHHLRVDGESWDWGGPAIREDEVRSISQLGDDEEFVLEGERAALRRGGLIDLTGEWPARLHGRRIVETQPQVPIVVNGREVRLREADVSFEDLVGLAFPGTDLTTSGSRALTVTYRRGPPDRPEGSLISREAIRVQPGEVFNVTGTNKS